MRDNARTLYWIDMDKGAVKRVAAEPIHEPINTFTYVWFPDSKWLAYTLTNRASFQTIQLYSVGSDQSYPLTDGLVEASEPVFDASGKYLYFLASTDSGPVKNWFDQSNTDMQASSSVNLVTLAKATANPLLKESDEEASGDADKNKDSKESKDADAKEKKEDKDKPAVVIDREGIDGRIVPLPIDAGNLTSLTAGSGGDLLPWMFRKFGLGKLVGRRTWGGLVGTLGFPILMDGGYVTAPDLAIFTEDG